MRTISFAICFSLSILWLSSVFGDDNTCWLLAPQQNEVWVIVYDADADGNRGNVIWEGKIDAGQKIKIESTDGHIRYDYKLDPDQPYDGDVSAGCFGQRSLSVE